MAQLKNRPICSPPFWGRYVETFLMSLTFKTLRCLLDRSK